MTNATSMQDLVPRSTCDQSSMSILDLHVSCKQVAELERFEVDVPDAVINFLRANILAGTDGGDADTSTVPADATGSADVASLDAFKGERSGRQIKWLLGRPFVVPREPQ
jgi:hypothetical protein